MFVKFQQGVESATLLLSIMTLNNVDRRIINEDAIEACVSLLKHTLSQFQASANLLSRGACAFMSVISPKRKRSANSPNGKVNRTNGKANGSMQWNKEQIVAYKKAHKLLTELFPSAITFMSRMSFLIEQVSLDDRQG